MEKPPSNCGSVPTATGAGHSVPGLFPALYPGLMTPTSPSYRETGPGLLGCPQCGGERPMSLTPVSRLMSHLLDSVPPGSPPTETSASCGHVLASPGTSLDILSLVPSKTQDSHSGPADTGPNYWPDGETGWRMPTVVYRGAISLGALRRLQARNPCDLLTRGPGPSGGQRAQGTSEVLRCTYAGSPVQV